MGSDDLCEMICKCYFAELLRCACGCVWGVGVGVCVGVDRSVGRGACFDMLSLHRCKNRCWVNKLF